MNSLQEFCARPAPDAHINSDFAKHSRYPASRTFDFSYSLDMDSLSSITVPISEPVYEALMQGFVRTDVSINIFRPGMTDRIKEIVLVKQGLQKWVEDKAEKK